MEEVKNNLMFAKSLLLNFQRWNSFRTSHGKGSQRRAEVSVQNNSFPFRLLPHLLTADRSRKSRRGAVVVAEEEEEGAEEK